MNEQRRDGRTKAKKDHMTGQFEFRKSLFAWTEFNQEVRIKSMFVPVSYRFFSMWLDIA